MTQRDTASTLAWLKGQHDSGSTSWRALCLKLQRSARNLPGVYGSALAAQHATPMSERVYDRKKWLAGMVVYIDDPNDSNKFGHIVSLRGRTKTSWAVWTNDALVRGGVSCVDVDWFLPNWGDRVQFAATSLNGYDLLLPKASVPKKPKPSHGPLRLQNLEYAIHRLDKAIAYHEKHNHPKLVEALKKDRAEIQQTIDRFQRK